MNSEDNTGIKNHKKGRFTKLRFFKFDKMDLYNHSPVFFQNILTTIEGKRRARLRFGKYYKQSLSRFLSFDYSDRSALDKLKNQKFLEIFNYAYNNSPFYKRFYKDVADKIHSIEDIALLPILEKETVRQNIEEIYTISEKDAYLSKTSGTTGKRLIFRHTLSDYQSRLAYLDSFKAKHGFIHRKMKRASFNSSNIVPPNQTKKVFWRNNRAMKQRVYSTHRCNGDNIPYYVNDLNKYKPASIDGYPSAIYDIAKYINENNINLNFTPIAIFTTSETLYPHYRVEIEKAFHCKVFDQYSSSEGATFIFECSNRTLHIGEDTGIIEFTDEGEMLITSFFSHGTPLIRYKIGDKALLSPNTLQCPCGSCLKTIEDIQGRNADYVLTPGQGKFTAIHLSTCLDSLNYNVKGAQFIQNEVDTLHVFLLVEKDYDAANDIILSKELSYKLGHDMNFIIHHVEELNKENSGKFRLIINNLLQS